MAEVGRQTPPKFHGNNHRAQTPWRALLLSYRHQMELNTAPVLQVSQG